MQRVVVQAEPFDLAKELEAIDGPQTGAVVSFTGIVRDVEGTLDYMEIEHYPAMTQSAIEAHVREAAKRFELTHTVVIHRYGLLKTGDQIMMVATGARHRADAFQGAEFLMDYLKSRAPFWKKEVTREGSAWVAPRTVDEEALKRW